MVVFSLFGFWKSTVSFWVVFVEVLRFCSNVHVKVRFSKLSGCEFSLLDFS